MAQSGLILSMDLQAGSARTVNTRMVIYVTAQGCRRLLRGVTADRQVWWQVSITYAGSSGLGAGG